MSKGNGKQLDIDKGYSDYKDNQTESAKLKTELEGNFNLAKAKLAYVVKAIALVPDQLEHDSYLAEETARDVLTQTEQVVEALEDICKGIPRASTLKDDIQSYEKSNNKKLAKLATETDEKARKPFKGGQDQQPI